MVQAMVGLSRFHVGMVIISLVTAPLRAIATGWHFQSPEQSSSDHYHSSDAAVVKVQTASLAA